MQKRNPDAKQMKKQESIKSKLTVVVYLTFMGILLFSDVTVYAENQNIGVNDNTYTQNYDGFGDTIRLLASLLFVLALIIGGVYLLKKIPFYKRFVNGVKRPISIISSISLGHKRSISVVRIADEVLIIGLTNTNVALLSKMKADEYYSTEDIITQNEEIPENDKGFLEQLKKAIQNRRFK